MPIGGPLGSAQWLCDLTDRSAVVKAINELQEIGEGRFLEKYGFERSRRIQIAYDGETFPSKAILGAAHAFSFLMPGPSGRQSSAEVA